MGLSSKQVSSDGLDWSQTLLQQAQTLELPKPPIVRGQQQQNQQQSEPLKCPRCDSTNTKFCYYNNYNKSQPRHFCKTCKRHWTKGGTLRNVPIGGGRKNKRLKTSKNTAKTASAAATRSATSTRTSSGSIINRVNPQIVIQAQHQKQNLPLAHGDQKSVSEIMCQAMISPPSSALQQNSMSCSNFSSKSFNTGNSGVFLGSTLSLPQNQGLHFPYSSSSTFDTHPSLISTSLQSSNLYNYRSGEAMEDSTITTVMPATSNTISHQPWQVPNASCGMDMTSYWNWDDIDTFVSTNLNVPWDDSELKP